MRAKILVAAAAVVGSLSVTTVPGSAATLDDVIARLDNLQRENTAMRREIAALRRERGPAAETSTRRPSGSSSGSGVPASQAATASTRPPGGDIPYAGPYDWSGFYAGVNAGYGSGSAQTKMSAGAISADDQQYDGFFAGGQLGYNYQWGSFVVGIEGDLQFANMGGRTAAQLVPVPYIAGNTLEMFGTARGRIGFAFDRFLPYVTGGFAAGRNSMEFISVTTNSVTDKRTHVGWTVGGGVEYALREGWSVKAEYLHVDLGEKSYVPYSSGGATVPTATLQFDLVRAGVNYHF
jgi:outer membrane immunogenic protein